MKYISVSAEETFRIGSELYRMMCHLVNDKLGYCLALEGELGTGKTVFVKGFLSAGGVNPKQVLSPTFIIMREYKGNIKFYHFDWYRLSSIEDLFSFGYEEYIARGRSISLIEWANKFKKALPVENTIWVKMRLLEQDKREIVIEFPGSSIG